MLEFDPAFAALIEGFRRLWALGGDAGAGLRGIRTHAGEVVERTRGPGSLPADVLCARRGGLQGGTVIGATNDNAGGRGPGSFTTEHGWSRERDVRPEDIEATIYSALGIDWTTMRLDDPLGRGYRYVPLSDEDVYSPLDELWAS